MFIIMSTLEAWYMDESSEDQRLPHKLHPNQPVSPQELHDIGVCHWKVRQTLSCGLMMVLSLTLEMQCMTRITQLILICFAVYLSVLGSVLSALFRGNSESPGDKLTCIFIKSSRSFAYQCSMKKEDILTAPGRR